MAFTKYTHPKDCPDHRAAVAGRKLYEAERLELQLRRQALAHADWCDWYARRSSQKSRSEL